MIAEMSKGRLAMYIMEELMDEVQDHLQFSEDEMTFRYNDKKTAARLLVKDGENGWENLCTVSTNYGLNFAVWCRSRYHDDVTVLLERVLYNNKVSHMKRPRGCGEIKHTCFEVEPNGKKRERVKA